MGWFKKKEEKKIIDFNDFKKIEELVNKNKNKKKDFSVVITSYYYEFYDYELLDYIVIYNDYRRKNQSHFDYAKYDINDIMQIVNEIIEDSNNLCEEIENNIKMKKSILAKLNMTQEEFDFLKNEFK
jgi:hypothetical protein